MEPSGDAPITAQVTVSALLMALSAAECYATALRTAGREADADLLDANLNLLSAQAGAPSPVRQSVGQGRRRVYAPGSRAGIGGRRKRGGQGHAR